MNFNYFHSRKFPGRARLGLTLATLGTAALIAGCGCSSESSSITVGNESDVSSVPHVSGEKTTDEQHAHDPDFDGQDAHQWAACEQSRR